MHEIDQFVKQLMEHLLKCSEHCKRNIKPDNRVQCIIWEADSGVMATFYNNSVI